MEMAKAIAKSISTDKEWEIKADISMLELFNNKENLHVVLGTSWPHFGYLYHNEDKLNLSWTDGLLIWKSYKHLEQEKRKGVTGKFSKYIG